MTPTKPIKLAARSISKRYGGFVALEGASFDLPDGEFLTLLGPSGSGKTTLLMIVSGLVEPSAGELLIDGKVATALPSHARDLGMVFQSYALFPHLTVAENVAFPLEMRRLPKPEIAERVKATLDLIRLGGMADRLPGQLSGGQQQRVALARAMVYRPSFILMDEPLGALDKKLREHMQSEIRHLHRELGITVLYVTHDQDEAMSLSDRICLMNNARIEQIGTPEEIYFRPRSRFAADFIGESNFLDVTVEGTEGGMARLRGKDGAVLRARGGMGAGAAVLAVRPERLSLLHGDAAAANALRGTVSDCVLLGATTRVEVQLATGEAMTVLQLTGSAPVPAPGTEVRLGWAEEAGVLLPHDRA
jgi:putative spermidine/putrescine transport system ATP-binding protein